eukprot:1149948-Pelagomonas_calceolata.AAC.2
MRETAHICTPHTLEPLKELGNTHAATKLVPIPSSTLINLLAPDALLKRLFSTLITKIRHGLLLATLLIPIDFFLFFLFKSLKGTHGASALGLLLSLIDVGSVFTTCTLGVVLFTPRIRFSKRKCMAFMPGGRVNALISQIQAEGLIWSQPMAGYEKGLQEAAV